MSTPERETQKRVIDLFCNELGYRYLGDWKDRSGNSNIEDMILSAYLGLAENQRSNPSDHEPERGCLVS